MYPTKCLEDLVITFCRGTHVGLTNKYKNKKTPFSDISILIKKKKIAKFE